MTSVLSTTNRHDRDQFIQFFEDGHKYIITNDPDSKYTSVTTLIHHHFPQFDADSIVTKMMSSPNYKEGHKYWGMTGDEIKTKWSNDGISASGLGTEMHYQIECFMNNPKLRSPYTHRDLYDELLKSGRRKRKQTQPPQETTEWSYFLDFIKSTPYLKPYRTEWTIYHEDLKLAGSVDMVYENSDGTLSIYDWKRSKEISRTTNFNQYATTESIRHIPNVNYWHYALQLNIYKAILETKYDKKVRDLYLVRLHPDNIDKTYDLIMLPILTNDINSIFEHKAKQLCEENA